MPAISRDCSAAVQQRQLSGNTHVFDRPRATASVSSALLTELNTTLNCLKVPHVAAALLCFALLCFALLCVCSRFDRTLVSAAPRAT
jgi:hypothetical protein